MLSWYREGDFFKSQYDWQLSLIHLGSSPLSQITFRLEQSAAYLILSPSRYYHAEFTHHYARFFTPSSCYTIERRNVSLAFNASLLSELITLFNYLNHQHQHPVFSADLINELKQLPRLLSQGTSFNANEYSYVLPKLVKLTAYVNPARKMSRTLLNMLNVPGEFNVNQLHRLLANGEDPVQEDLITGYTPLHFAMGKTTAILPLLEYGANPFIRSKLLYGGFISPYEYAVENNNIQALKIITGFTTRISTVSPKQVINQIDCFASRQYFLTAFYFANETLFSKLKKIQHFTPQEKQELFDLYTTVFQAPDDDSLEKIRQEFNKDVADQDTLVDGLYNSQRKLIGFTIATLKSIGSAGNLDVAAVGLSPTYRFGAMLFFMMRLAFGAQLIILRPLWVSYHTLAGSKSERFAPGLKYPKYQDAKIAPFVEKIFYGMYQQHRPFDNDMMTYQNPAAVGFRPLKTNHLQQSPVLFPVGADAFWYFQKMLFPFGINFKEQVEQCAYYFPLVLQGKLNNTKPTTLPDSRWLFFNGTYRASPIQLHPKSQVSTKKIPDPNRCSL